MGYHIIHFADRTISNGEFEYTTNGDENVYIENGQLIIKPTLWDDETVLTSDYTLNLTALETCTATDATDCVASTNTSSGTIINPIKSGRVNTKKAAYIKYGRVEVEAQLPVGDWIWPAIWMLPVVNIYGAWPASGEIDLVESRGNNHTYAQGGNNIISSTMHWGPNSNEDSYWRTSKKHSSLHSTYTAGFHKFGLEWSDSYLFTYVDSRLQQVLYSPFSEPQWTRGDFPSREGNEVLVDPWSQTGRDNTPFDTEFYLILNVAVGSTNGWFEDGKSGKPWVDDAPSAMADFWAAKDEWYPTWVDGKAQMTIKSIKIWQQCN
jgi:beta-glucanase (GH16 family)